MPGFFHSHTDRRNTPTESISNALQRFPRLICKEINFPLNKPAAIASYLSTDFFIDGYRVAQPILRACYVIELPT